MRKRSCACLWTERYTRAPNRDKRTERDRFFWWTVRPLIYNISVFSHSLKKKKISGINKICIKASLILDPILCKKANLTTNGTGMKATYSYRLQWQAMLSWVLYFVFCCPLCNGWLEELIHLFASCVVWRQNLLLLHILNVLAQLEPFINKMCHFDHKCHCGVWGDCCIKAMKKNCNVDW